MVRAQKLETTPGGTYYNLAVGAVSRPAVTAVAFDWDGHVPTAQNPWKQWVEIDFSQQLAFDPAAITVAGQAWTVNGLQPRTLQYGVDYKIVPGPDATRHYLVFLDPLDGNPNVDTAAIAPNGIWTVTVPASPANAFGGTLGAAQTFDFVTLASDANNDGRVDFADQVILAQNYNAATVDAASPRAWGDFDCNGTVDFNDLVLLAQLYQVDLLA